MGNIVEKNGLQIDKQLVDFLEQEVLAGLSETPEQVWSALACLVEEFQAPNQQLLAKRKRLQEEIDLWSRSHKNPENISAQNQYNFLSSIGYVVNKGEPFNIGTDNVDDEIALIAGPQLVVPVSNARFAVNALNARYGSLYDALYSTDAIDTPLPMGQEYCPIRGRKVVSYCRRWLDQVFPIEHGSHSCAMRYLVDEKGLAIVLEDGNILRLSNQNQYVGHIGAKSAPSTIVLKHSSLHVLIEIDAQSDIGKLDKAGLEDIILESAITAIQDFEDSVAAVDAEDKVAVYRNWLGLMRGDIQATYLKGGKTRLRKPVADKSFVNKDSQIQKLRTRSLLLCRNVGLLMTNPMVKLSNGNEVYEGIVDALVSVLIAKHDLLKAPESSNSPQGSIYIVKPKLHGPEEAAFVNQLFSRVEQLLNLPPNTVKLGIMDEERRTSVNLTECIRAVKDRVAFINTGFLDRTGDEIHTSKYLGPFANKANIKNEVWYAAYEKLNVDSGLRSGFSTKAQIGKGMWAKPDNLKDMLIEKQDQLVAGATTAWVPSPQAATLHALHYHEIDVLKSHAGMPACDEKLTLSLLNVPIDNSVVESTQQEVQRELDNNAQGILGYMVRWVDQGIGCSKVPDIDDVNLMEDRATLRISSQHIANWLLHDIVSKEQVEETFQRMAHIVDAQNSSDVNYRPMAENFEENLAFKAALELVFSGAQQPNGYTEPVLHKYRTLVKNTHKDGKILRN